MPAKVLYKHLDDGDSAGDEVHTVAKTTWSDDQRTRFYQWLYDTNKRLKECGGPEMFANIRIEGRELVYDE